MISQNFSPRIPIRFKSVTPVLFAERMSWIDTSQIPAGDRMGEVATQIFIHEKGWHITRDSGGRFALSMPDWTPYPPRPR